MTLFSSIGSLVIDYVFIDVLSAPTAVSLKVASQRARTETTRSQINRRARQLLEAGSQDTGGAPITMAHKTYLFEDEVRVVSPELIDAHAEAIATAGHMLEDTQDKIKKVTEARNTIRLTKIQKSEDEKSSVPIASQSLTSDELMSAMFMEIKEEREKIKKATERLSFDSLWG